MTNMKYLFMVKVVRMCLHLRGGWVAIFMGGGH